MHWNGRDRTQGHTFVERRWCDNGMNAWMSLLRQGDVPHTCWTPCIDKRHVHIMCTTCPHHVSTTSCPHHVDVTRNSSDFLYIPTNYSKSKLLKITGNELAFLEITCIRILGAHPGVPKGPRLSLELSLLMPNEWRPYSGNIFQGEFDVRSLRVCNWWLAGFSRFSWFS